MAIDWNKLGEERQRDKNRFYIIIDGDKEFNSETLIPLVVNDMVQMIDGETVLFEFTDRLLRKRVKDGFEIMVFTGDNNGVDQLAVKYANTRGYSISEYHANWDFNGNKAGYMRNSNMFSHVGMKPNNGAILFWDGENKYTRNLIYLGWECGVSLRVYNYKKKAWVSEKEVESIQMDERRVQLGYGRGF